MRSKIRRAPAPPQPSVSNRPSQVVFALVLLLVGGAAALSAERLVPASAGPQAKASATIAAASPGSSSAGANSSDSAQGAASELPSASASARPSPAAPVLEAEMPHSVNGKPLTTESATDATSLGSNPTSRALNAAVVSLGKKPADLEIADAFDASGSLSIAVLGFRVAGIDPAKLRSIILDTWLAANAPGVQTSSVSLSGIASTKVSYGDTRPSEFVFVHGDGVFMVETTDQSLAAAIVAAMARPAASPSPSS